MSLCCTVGYKWVTVMDGIKFESNDIISLYTKNDSERRWFVSLGYIIFKEKLMENLVPNFKNLVIKEKIFTIFQPLNYLQIFAILTYFV